MVRDILTRSRLDKLIFKIDKGKEPTKEELHSKFYKLIKERKLEEKIKDQVTIELNTNLMQKIAELKNYIKDPKLRGLIIRLEEEYINSVLESDQLIDILFDIYDATHVNRDITHNCNFRWFEFKKQIQPCIDKQTSEQIRKLLSKTYAKDIQLTISEDCTQNAYHLLNCIYTSEIPTEYVPPRQNKQRVTQVLPRFKSNAPTQPNYIPCPPVESIVNNKYVGLYDFLLSIENYLQSRKSDSTRNIFLDNLKNLHPKAAFVFATFNIIFRNKACKKLRYAQYVGVDKRRGPVKEINKCLDSLEAIDLKGIRESINFNEGQRNLRDFYEKVKMFEKCYTFHTGLDYNNNYKGIEYNDNDFELRRPMLVTNRTRRNR